MKIVIVLFLFCNISIISQTVYEPIYNESIYAFLDRLKIKGIINIHDEVKPLSRSEIAKCLLTAKIHLQLNELEKKELEFYLNEYSFEIEQHEIINKQDTLTIFSHDKYERFRTLRYTNERFHINADPILGASYSTSRETKFHRWNGISIWGTISSHIGYRFDFRDNLEIFENVNIDRAQSFSKKPGRKLMRSSIDTQEFSEVHATITGSWPWASLTIGKDYLTLGSGYDSQLILSSKAPSFPFIRVTITPVHWLNFNYIHGWLNSGLIDSSTIRYTTINTLETNQTYDRRQKYIASHMLSLYPIKNFSISIGESIVYSDKLEFAYLIPIMFFRLADHYMAYTSDAGDSGDNAQLFFDACYKIPQFRTRVYSSFYTDEFNFDYFSDESKGAITAGYTFGINIVDAVIPNSELIIEYTRINPFVYMNFNPAQTYTSNGYQLGHWIGSNADQIYMEYKQGLLRGLYLSVFGEFIRKGQKETTFDQYTLPHPDFLYGKKNYYRNFGAELKYQITHNLFAQTSFSYVNWSGEATGDYMDNKRGVYSFSLYYGL